MIMGRINIQGKETFGSLLRQARLARGWGQRELGRRANLDASYINRLEGGIRTPRRDAALALAGALEIAEAELDQWLITAGLSPVGLLTAVGGAVRTRGGLTGAMEETESSHGANLDALPRLELMGLQEAAIRRLLQAAEAASPDDRQKAAQALTGALSQLAQTLASPVHTAVIPAAGGQHRMLERAIMQRLLLRGIAEAVEEGISSIILILASGTKETLFKPLEDAMGMVIVPPIRLQCAIQSRPEGIGDAILRAEPYVRDGPFAVLLPDDFVVEDNPHRKYPKALRAMMDALKRKPGSNLLAVTPVMKSKVSSYGIAKVRSEKTPGRIHRVKMLVEKPDPHHPICQREPIYRIAGRYLLQPGIFDAFRVFKKIGAVPVELTDAIELMRSGGHPTLAVEMKQAAEKMSRLIGRALDMIQN